MVDVAHDRHHRRPLDELLLGVVEHRLGDRLVLGMDDLDVLAELGREHLDRRRRTASVVSVFISPSAISCFMISGTGTSRYSATSLTVDPELIRIASGSASADCDVDGRDSASSSYTPRRRRPRRCRRGGWLVWREGRRCCGAKLGSRSPRAAGRRRCRARARPGASRGSGACARPRRRPVRSAPFRAGASPPSAGAAGASPPLRGARAASARAGPSSVARPRPGPSVAAASGSVGATASGRQCDRGPAHRLAPGVRRCVRRGRERARRLRARAGGPSPDGRGRRHRRVAPACPRPALAPGRSVAEDRARASASSTDEDAAFTSQAGRLQPLEDLLGGEPVLLGDLMHALIHLHPV